MSLIRQVKLQDGTTSSQLASVNSLGEVSVVDINLATISSNSLIKLTDIETAVQAVEENQTDKSQYSKITDGTNDLSINSDGSVNSLSKSEQPDGDIVNVRADGQATLTDTPLIAGATYTSSWVDSDGWSSIQVFVMSDVISASKGIEVQFTGDVSGTPVVEASKFFEFKEVDVARGFLEIPLNSSLDGFRVTYTNGSIPQASFRLETTLRTNQSPILYNKGNSQVLASFYDEVAQGNISNYSDNVKFGAVFSLNTGAPPVDVVDFGTATAGDYTGFNATGNENIELFSSDTADAGSLVSSGTTTTASHTQIIDSTATFVTDGVAVGDIVLNDTQGLHGIIKTVDSETTLTVYEMCNGSNGQFSNASGSSYRVATTAGTGAAVVRVEGVLDEDYEKQKESFVIMNGATGVTLTIDAMRCSRGKVLLAGSNGENDGMITARQATTTANVFWRMSAGKNRTLNMAETVPANKIFEIKRLQCGMVRANGSGASGFVSFRTRQIGEVFQSLRYEPISTSSPYREDLEGGIVLKSGTDYKFRVESLSDNNIDVSAHLENLEIER